jgi:pyruvate carboxylase
MLSGGLGKPLGGWPKKLQQVVLGPARRDKPLRGRPGASLKPLNFKKIEHDLAARLKRVATADDVFSYVMYPEVFADYARKVRDYGDLSAVPTPAFFYGLKVGQEISVEIEEGKTLFIRLVNVNPVDAEGRRTLIFELNGMPRQLSIADRSVLPKIKPRVKADPAVPAQIGAPIPGLVTALTAGVGTKVAKGDKLLTLEAMKMQTTIYAPCDGVVEQIFVQVGETVESKDLLMRLREA